MLNMILLGNVQFAFSSCVEWEISCGDLSTFKIATLTKEFSDGQKLSSSEREEITAGCACAHSTAPNTCDATTDSGTKTVTLSCSKRETSDDVTENLIVEEETLLEEGAIAAAGVLALAAFASPPLPMFPPQGLPQPQATGGGILPAVALTVSNI